MRATSALLLLLLAACGGEPARRGGTSSAPDPLPRAPEDALARLEEVRDDEPALRTLLAAWPLGGAFETAEATRTALTWRIQLALRRGEVAAAAADHALLVRRFDGRGRTPTGRTLSPTALRLGIFEEALGEARRRIDGPVPRPARARVALEVAEGLLGEGDAEDRARLAGTRTWVTRDRLDEMLAAVGAQAPPADDAAVRLVILADDFVLGEDVLREVLKQWARDAGGERFARDLVPLLRGQVRVNVRLVPVESEAEELASIGRRAREAGLRPLRAVRARALRSLGLDVGDAAILLAKGDGQIVARLSGRGPDLRVLEPALQKLLTR